MAGYVYILASGPYGTLYIGVTKWLVGRICEHREDEGRGSAFCKKYGVTKLVYYEEFDDIRDAIHREKRLKKWPRRWKISLIVRDNPAWVDLFDTLERPDQYGSPGSPPATVG